MKKELFVTTLLLLGFSFKSFAGTGRVDDGIEFFLFILGILLIVLFLLNGFDYMKKNGKMLLKNTKSFLNRNITLIGNFLNKIKSEFIDIAYF